jgi:hypothetical protein
VQGKEGVRGYMPLQYQAGFIYDNPDAVLIAHELAHGAFTLWHTFSSEQYIAQQGATSNLMDYNNGAELWKHQWRLISDPKNLWFKAWQDEEEGEASTNAVLTILKKLRIAKMTNTPAEISLKKNAWLTTGYSCTINGYTYKTIAIEAREDISSLRVDEIYEGIPLAPSLIIGDLFITLEKEEDQKMLYKYLTNPGKAILFVHGYKFGLPEKANTDNSIATNDQHSYWEGIDISFVNRLKSGKPFYANGHMNISTSNHVNMANFYCSARSCIDIWPSSITEFILKYADIAISKEIDAAVCDYPRYVAILNRAPNVDGFNQRKAEGKIGGRNFVKQLKEASYTASDTLDIVCHSMFAYALGVIEEIKTQMPDITLGGFYIIAPENGCSGEVNVSDWQEIWQYGSDEENDPLDKQDGVAPQCPVNNIGDNRAFIPNDVKKGFISSHSIENYKWIFTKPQKKGDPGYVTPRK